MKQKKLTEEDYFETSRKYRLKKPDERISKIKIGELKLMGIERHSITICTSAVKRK